MASRGRESSSTRRRGGHCDLIGMALEVLGDYWQEGIDIWSAADSGTQAKCVG